MPHKRDINAAPTDAAKICRNVFGSGLGPASEVAAGHGTVIYVGDDLRVALAAFRRDLLQAPELCRQTVFLEVETSATVAHVPVAERVRGDRFLGSWHGCRFRLTTLRYGFDDDIDVPADLTIARSRGAIAFEPRDV